MSVPFCLGAKRSGGQLFCCACIEPFSVIVLSHTSCSTSFCFRLLRAPQLYATAAHPPSPARPRLLPSLALFSCRAYLVPPVRFCISCPSVSNTRSVAAACAPHIATASPQTISCPQLFRASWNDWVDVCWFLLGDFMSYSFFHRVHLMFLCSHFVSP
jgi:hypothetical protein